MTVDPDKWINTSIWRKSLLFLHNISIAYKYLNLNFYLQFLEGYKRKIHLTSYSINKQVPISEDTLIFTNGQIESINRKN